MMYTTELLRRHDRIIVKMSITVICKVLSHAFLFTIQLKKLTVQKLLQCRPLIPHE